ncbi:PadR family transcriptional regulator [Deinococcus malanensis]|uniref:PadR family transcriptional regulator n=1 Tax=Deinococcus malanensis TaxID=1706855 RepID=A0ABQ2F0E3_9DEIO|nr:PadR family transcriptional regulator [Deinococcus malanensis]GGK34460.1 PadR family transcriptional regulator [Deinococcus malanensis]
MSDQHPSPHDLLPLTPAVLHILLALADGEKHGYTIMKAVETHSEGQTRMGPGTLYGTLKRLLTTRLVQESDERPDPSLDDQRRRYYSLTSFGQRVLNEEVERLGRLVQAARRTPALGGL